MVVKVRVNILLCLMILYLVAGYGSAFAESAPPAMVKSLEARINNAVSGATLRIPPGRFKMEKAITIFRQGTKLIGAGSGKTILDFGSVRDGGQAILIRESSISIEGITVLNAPGDGIVARGVRDVAIRDVAVRWEDAKAAGGYGIYPVQCNGVLVEGSEVTGATEAGIYVGQTQGATVTGNTTYGNVVGIDIENSSSVIVRENHSYGNSVGIAVTGRPYLVVKNPAYIRITGNVIENNNRENFGPIGAFTTALGHGANVIVVAVRELTIKNNYFGNGGRLGTDIVIADFGWLNRSYKSDGLFKWKSEQIEIGANYVFDGDRQANVFRVEHADPPANTRPLRVELKAMGKGSLVPERVCVAESMAVNLKLDGVAPELNLPSCELK